MSNRVPYPLIVSLALVTAALCLSGCSSDDPTEPGDPVVGYPWPDTADKLMENFARAYGEMNIDSYDAALHEDFKFIFIDNATTWYKADDMASTTNMFAGNPGQDPDSGELRDGVQSISVISMIQQTPWEPVPAEDPDFPNTENALYQVVIVFTLDGGLNTITIDCDQEFFVKSEDVDEGGSKRTRYFLIGQRDLGSSPWKDDSITWGQIKAIFDTRDGKSGAIYWRHDHALA